MTGHTPLPVYEFGGFHLDVGRRQLRAADGAAITVSAKGFDILLYMVEHYGQLVEKSKLMQAVWPNVVVEENNLNQNIFLLRLSAGDVRGAWNNRKIRCYTAFYAASNGRFYSWDPASTSVAVAMRSRVLLGDYRKPVDDSVAAER